MKNPRAFSEKASHPRLVNTVILTFIFALLLIFSGCGGSNDSPAPSSSPTVTSTIQGLVFGPYVDGSDPDLGASVPLTTVTSLMDVLHLFGAEVQWLRTYGSGRGLQHVTELGHNMGFKIAAGAWINSDSLTNQQEITNVIAAAKAGQVDAIIVGSEVLLRGDMEEADLINLIQHVRQETPGGVVVTYADTYREYLNRPALMAEVDVICAHFYPFWEGISLDQAIGAVTTWYEALLNAGNRKPVWVCESGWPTQGSAQGNAVPSLQNAVDYLTQFLSWAESLGIQYFYFEAFDEPWKSRLEGDVGAHWGLWDQFGNLKPGMEGPLLEGVRNNSD